MLISNLKGCQQTKLKFPKDKSKQKHSAIPARQASVILENETGSWWRDF